MLCAILAYSWWAAVTPIYFKWLASVPLIELVIWRILSGLPILIGILLVKKQVVNCFKSLKDRKTLLYLIGSTFFIAINWITFVLAIVQDKLTAASLGYYINPLVTVAIGFLILKEKIRPLQIVAVLLAISGVVFLTWEQGELPWISLALAGTFAMYGLLRKVVSVGSIEGLTVEMTFAYPICLAFQWYAVSTQQTIFYDFNGMYMFGLLLGGIMTIIPLVLFTVGARRVRLSTMGILQYIAPTGQLILAVVVFKEPFEQTQRIVFLLIWAAVLLYSFDSIRAERKKSST